MQIIEWEKCFNVHIWERIYRQNTWKTFTTQSWYGEKLTKKIKIFEQVVEKINLKTIKQ